MFFFLMSFLSMNVPQKTSLTTKSSYKPPEVDAVYLFSPKQGLSFTEKPILFKKGRHVENMKTEL